MTILFRSSMPYIVCLVAMFILLFLLIRGCSNSRQVIAINKELKAKNDSLEAKIKRDSIEAIQNKNEYDSKLDVANGQIEIKDNQLARTEDELGAANKRINVLISNHHDIKPSTDTSITIVPNDFVIDCNGCFVELQNGQKLVQKYKTDVDQLNFEWHKKSILQTNRINQQEQEKTKLAKSLQDCMDISKAAQKAGTPKGQLYFSWGVQFSPLPKMAAVGLLYQNKRKLIYGAKGWFGAYGTMVEANMNMPLSFKRKLF